MGPKLQLGKGLCFFVSFFFSVYVNKQLLKMNIMTCSRSMASAGVSSDLRLALNVQQNRTDNANIPACRESGQGDVHSCW